MGNTAAVISSLEPSENNPPKSAINWVEKRRRQPNQKEWHKYLRDHAARLKQLHKCVQCFVDFKNRQALLAHVASRHSSTVSYSTVLASNPDNPICLKCRKSFDNDKTLKLHYQKGGCIDYWNSQRKPVAKSSRLKPKNKARCIHAAENKSKTKAASKPKAKVLMPQNMEVDGFVVPNQPVSKPKRSTVNKSSRPVDSPKVKTINSTSCIRQFSRPFTSTTPPASDIGSCESNKMIKTFQDASAAAVVSQKTPTITNSKNIPNLASESKPVITPIPISPVGQATNGEKRKIVECWRPAKFPKSDGLKVASQQNKQIISFFPDKMEIFNQIAINNLKAKKGDNKTDTDDQNPAKNSLNNKSETTNVNNELKNIILRGNSAILSNKKPPQVCKAILSNKVPVGNQPVNDMEKKILRLPLPNPNVANRAPSSAEPVPEKPRDSNNNSNNKALSNNAFLLLKVLSVQVPQVQSKNESLRSILPKPVNAETKDREHFDDQINSTVKAAKTYQTNSKKKNLQKKYEVFPGL